MDTSLAISIAALTISILAGAIGVLFGLLVKLAVDTYTRETKQLSERIGELSRAVRDLETKEATTATATTVEMTHLSQEAGSLHQDVRDLSSQIASLRDALASGKGDNT